MRTHRLAQLVTTAFVVATVSTSTGTVAFADTTVSENSTDVSTAEDTEEQEWQELEGGEEEPNNGYQLTLDAVENDGVTSVAIQLAGGEEPTQYNYEVNIDGNKVSEGVGDTNKETELHIDTSGLSGGTHKLEAKAQVAGSIYTESIDLETYRETEENAVKETISQEALSKVDIYPSEKELEAIKAACGISSTNEEETSNSTDASGTLIDRITKNGFVTMDSDKTGIASIIIKNIPAIIIGLLVIIAGAFGIKVTRNNKRIKEEKKKEILRLKQEYSNKHKETEQNNTQDTTQEETQTEQDKTQDSGDV